MNTSLRLPSLLVCHLSTSPAQVEGDGEPDDLYRSIVLEMKGHDPTVMASYQKYLCMTCEELGIHVERVWELPKCIERRSLLKSVHIYKKHFRQYESRTHFRNIELKRLTGSTADTFLEYIERNLPEGMALKVTKHRIEPLPPHIRPAPKQVEDDSTITQ
ncbi:hypothetical protein CAPTEDRAFT_172568 [Capitella teleta]|uniref:Small ribosomal subunit protein uS10m n=1 Tax=Capitella teleta TaxID=283909 RepID=R7U0I8_CAPTE|nr:hypothetical protein CAPTEDRAFT_172568 [Capitella teleta]|eukprot:ELT99519.1 hypothetical protein CAPTEDRAFT_172568 [Capitella teleta]